MPDPLPHSGLEALYQLWLKKRGGRLMPRRADIDPTEIPGALWPNIMMVEVLREAAGMRFRYRRVGTAFSEAFGSDPTGRFLDEALPEIGGYRDYVLEIYRYVATERRPLYTENIIALANQSLPTPTKRLTLPLSQGGDDVAIMLNGHIFDYDRTKASATPLATILTRLTWLPLGEENGS